MTVDVGLLYSRIRQDEKLLLAELRDRGHEVHKVDVRDQQFGPQESSADFDAMDVVLDRTLATSRSLYTTSFLDAYDVPVINDAETARVCADKVQTTLALAQADVQTPETKVAYTVDSAMEAIESFGYPVVLKPVVGSWGRLLARIEDEHAAEALLEHKATLGHYEHKVFYIQEFVDKPGRDFRVLALDGTPVAGMVRSSDHWLTNAAKGAKTAELEITPEIAEIVENASAAVGGGMLGIDIMETEDGEYTVHEINHTVEFKALTDAVEVDVPAAVVDWLEVKVAQSTEGSTGEVTA
ncbi:arginine biosynthesis regulator [Halanaeroarchaeum sulfurireducens]|uniref:Arginine biosynthesis regulator n=1 Tax=Halanaeroarchaeum sulfurireducens TaxID=1604004 RepID=A0A0F7PH66_9EURY|nr:arginine biosynthesis regulator [Halanaeroarchaeum sulfurireducens]ALG83040.1 arginine biosynthesis regulator [Halanaeroarchaeum sulfurireducens]